MHIHILRSLLVLWQVGLPLIHAAPLGPDPIIIQSDGNIVYMADHPAHRIAAIVLCIFYAFLLALAQGECIRTILPYVLTVRRLSRWSVGWLQDDDQSLGRTYIRAGLYLHHLRIRRLHQRQRTWPVNGWTVLRCDTYR
jgi:hypothetical protein